jgi:hypothetical protein
MQGFSEVSAVQLRAFIEILTENTMGDAGLRIPANNSVSQVARRRMNGREIYLTGRIPTFIDKICRL